MKNKLLLGLGLGVTAYLASQKKEEEANTISPTTDPKEILVTATPQEFVTATVPSKLIGSLIDYQEWRLPEWAKYFQDIATKDGYEMAARRVWDEWNSPKNPNLLMLPTREAMFLALTMYKEQPKTIGSIAWNSQPIYSTWTRWWYGEYYWDLEEWMYWHQALERRYGDTLQANSTFMSAWNHPDNKLCSFVGCWDCTATRYFVSKGLNIMSYGASTLCNVRDAGSAIITNTANTGANLSQGASNLSQGVANASQSVASVATILPWVALGLGGYWVWRKTNNSQNDETN